MKPGKTGISRIIAAGGYSLRGLRFAWKNEAAFRQEVIAALVLIPSAFYLGESGLEIALLLIPVFLVLIVEIVNSAIEAITDRVGSEFHELSGAAKDLGSAAVMVGIILLVLVWGAFLLDKFIS